MRLSLYLSIEDLIPVGRYSSFFLGGGGERFVELSAALLR